MSLGLLVALVLLAPILLGPALGPLTHALGGEVVHHCACGMVAGTCGCPECEKLEHERQRDREAPYPMVKGSCTSDDMPFAFAPLPVVQPAAEATPFVLAAPVARLPLVDVDAWSSRPALAPPTPPPEATRRS